MTHIDYFKLQAKNLFRDYKTQTSYIDKADGNIYFKYVPRYFDIDEIILAYDLDEENLSLMKFQHIFALILGFKKWTELTKASESELELAKLIFDNQDKISQPEWEMYIARIDVDDAESKLEIYKHVFLNVEGHHSPFPDIRLNARSG